MFVFLNERDAPPVEDQPTVAVNSWCVVQATNGDRHLVAILGSGSLRLTSALASFSPTQCELTTQSGRRYQLPGPPETRQPQLAILHANALRSGLHGAIDVSDEIWRSTLRH